MIKVSVSPDRIQAGDDANLEITLTNQSPGQCLNVIFAFRLPTEIKLRHGRSRVTVDKLAAGEWVTSTFQVQAELPGRYQLTSRSFSYQDYAGQPHTEDGYAVEITVEPGREPLPEPVITVEQLTAELPLGEWQSFRSRVRNADRVDITSLKATLSGQITTDRPGQSFELERLNVGDSAEASFNVLAPVAGTHVPVHLKADFQGPSRAGHIAATWTVMVSSRPAPAEGTPVRILFVGANPRDVPRLRIDEEIREIQETIMAGRERERISVDTLWAARPRDITQALLRFSPHFVHFAGHGGGQEESFAAEDDAGFAHVIPPDGLVGAFQAVGEDAQCVIVNACRTKRLAWELAEAGVPYSIGMRQPVGDQSAIWFSIGFYQALAAGRPVETSFRAGIAQMKMAPGGQDAEVPVFYKAGPNGPVEL